MVIGFVRIITEVVLATQWRQPTVASAAGPRAGRARGPGQKADRPRWSDRGDQCGRMTTVALAWISSRWPRGT
jgi:hypothetical protein